MDPRIECCTAALDNALLCRFKDASVTIRKTTTAFHYQLVVCKIYEEGERELINDEEDEEDEFVFLIDKEMKFHISFGSHPALLWTDPTDAFTYKFTVDQNATNKLTLDFFNTTVLECMFERLYQKPHSNATTADFEQLQQSRDPKDEENLRSLALSNLQASSSSTPKKQTLKEAAAIPSTPTPPPTTNSFETSNALDTLAPFSKPRSPFVPTGTSLLQLNAELYLYDSTTSEFKLHTAATSIEILSATEFSHWILLSSHLGPILSQPIEAEMNPSFRREFNSFIWVYADAANEIMYSWSLRFHSIGDESLFRETFTRCLYETLNQLSFQKLAKADQSCLVASLQAQDVEMTDANDFSDDSDDENSDKDVSDSFDDAKDNEEVPQIPSSTSGVQSNRADSADENSHLAVGFNSDRSFVVRGSRIGVFKHDHDSLQYSTTINNIQAPSSGAFFSPAKVMLHEQDRSMILMNPKDPASLFKMDLEYGKVVEEWKMGEGADIQDFIPDTKYAQMTPAQTLVGIGKSSLFRIDPRLSGQKRVDSESMSYKTRVGFSCASTTGKGELVVASHTGDIRLYNKLSIRAKTHLPGIDPILGVDVTEDGKFILATCKTYLLVVSTEKSAGADAKNGFQQSLGAEKPVPKRLQLKPEHVTWMNASVSFTPARFNTGPGMEKTIVTSTGPFVITWNFRRVKQGHISDYSIKRYSDNVIADNFKYGSDRDVIVTLPNDVTMVSKKHLGTPTKQGLTPRKATVHSSRDAIVNSPF